jgi:predicted DNA-binding protein with PD1-like motif
MHPHGSIETFALRLSPGTDVRQALTALAKQKPITAGIILSAVGSLSQVCLRFADQSSPTCLDGNHEILTLSGTLGEDGIHLHMTVANAQGECKGGHLTDGCRVYTTLELVLGLLPDLEFHRVFDMTTGFKELAIASTTSSNLSRQEY